MDDPDAKGVKEVRNKEAVSPFTADQGTWEASQALQQGTGEAPTENQFSALWSCQKATDVNYFEYFEELVYTCKN